MKSGIDNLPLIISLLIAVFVSEAIIAKTVYYVGQSIAYSIIMSIGAGLLTTLKVNTGHSMWIGYHAVYGFGLGLGMQQASMAAQTCLDRKDVTAGVSLNLFFQGLEGPYYLLGKTIFTHSLVSRLGKLSDLKPAMILGTGATDLRTLVPSQYLDTVLVAYNTALSDTFKVG